MITSTKGKITAMIREAIVNALATQPEALTPTSHDERGFSEVPLEERKAHAAGKAQGRLQFSEKSPEELQAAYLVIEAKAEQFYADPIKHAYLWGVLDKIRDILKRTHKMDLPKKGGGPWVR